MTYNKALFGLTAALLLGGCVGEAGLIAPVRDVRYAAIGHDPFWSMAIGDDRIVLTLGDQGGRADGALNSYAFPRVLPRTADGVRIWQSGEGTSVLTAEARPGPCTGSGGLRYADQVRVRLSGRELTGCGGRMLEGRS